MLTDKLPYKSEARDIASSTAPSYALFGFLGGMIHVVHRHNSPQYRHDDAPNHKRPRNPVFPALYDAKLQRCHGRKHKAHQGTGTCPNQLKHLRHILNPQAHGQGPASHKQRPDSMAAAGAAKPLTKPLERSAAGDDDEGEGEEESERDAEVHADDHRRAFQQLALVRFEDIATRVCSKVEKSKEAY
eukprot:CAMPEP_0173384680 /NCGR_PEP_ID=MMETSP1356-20130122/7246_1 /TAXON_ID=77927 ORGANISM="Hemiselmis virescens, Strain PCC157" /NCGR_SAMPLE_ID=MMETSP1356 /ASSEMBLY_ACC=CAM_ASM_000847 /LENGTH=186 /DNA_ID=CAMNT_0014340153 /DNA_START=357 /DNA_END=917 /DNA_ORIENTATION=-